MPFYILEQIAAVCVLDLGYLSIVTGMEKWKHLKIPFLDIMDATKNFQKEIGRGGYGSVYEGKLLINGSYMKVAVKRLNEKDGQGLKEFLNEIDLLSGKQHPNLITLVGYCDEVNEKIIVYEFAERGSLDNYFRFRNASYTLTWMQRLKVLVDAARGLDHLHNRLGKKHAIIHRDIKSSNILLDQNWVAKVSDFGLSKSTFFDSGRSIVISYACGTKGYVEPELAKYLMVSKKSDVYSFGMVLFEVLCGRLCNYPYEDGILLSADEAKNYYTNGELDMIIDPFIREQMSPESLKKFSAIAISCLKPRGQRPLIDVVKKELEEMLKIQTRNMSRMNEGSMPGMKEWNALRIPFQEIREATKDFTNVINQEGNGFVYKGELSLYGISTKVAVKRSKQEFGQVFKEFLAEIFLLSTQQHENIVNFVGFCDEGKEMITVYEYAEHRSLDQYIRCSDTNYTLTWLERLKIVVDVARGLNHLHNHLQNNHVIIHRDIKSSNILLDDNWVAKISNFGLGKFIYPASGVTFIVSSPCGTMGYVDPEYVKTGIVTRRSDVYSFGMILLEVLCGRLASVRDRDEDNPNLARVALEYHDNDQLDKIIDPIIREQVSPNSLKKFSAIAYKCLQARVERPTMDVVNKELEEMLKLEVLHWRSFISRHWYVLNVEDLSPETHTMVRDTVKS